MSERPDSPGDEQLELQGMESGCCIWIDPSSTREGLVGDSYWALPQEL